MNRSAGMLKMMALADFLTRAGRMIGRDTAIALLAGLMLMEAGCGADPDAALPGLSGDASVDRRLDAESERADRATDRSDAAADSREEPTGLGDTDSSI